MRAMALLALLFCATPADAARSGCNGQTVEVPEGIKLVCSATWQMDGVCAGQDLWDKWKVTGAHSYPDDPFIRPFENVPILVIGYSLMRIQDMSSPAHQAARAQNESASWFMIGSAMFPQPDAMVWLGPGQYAITQMWPPGMGQLWPAKKKPEYRLTDMIDLHGVCWGNGTVQVLVTVYYTPLH